MPPDGERRARRASAAREERVMSTNDEPQPVPSPPTQAADELPAVDLWLLDGFNVLHAVLLGGQDRGRFWDEANRGRLIQRLASGLAGRPPIVLVFDGGRPVEGGEAHPAPGIELVFAPSADDWIVKRARLAQRAEKERAQQGPGPPAERVGVVSNDRKVVGRCRHAGALVVSPAAFMAGLAPTAPDGDGCAEGWGEHEAGSSSERGEEKEKELRAGVEAQQENDEE
jgi:hypothetical protein